MSLAEIEKAVPSLTDAEQQRLMAVLVAQREGRSGEDLLERAERLDREDQWISWEDVKKDLKITDEELGK